MLLPSTMSLFWSDCTDLFSFAPFSATHWSKNFLSFDRKSSRESKVDKRSSIWWWKLGIMLEFSGVSWSDRDVLISCSRWLTYHISATLSALNRRITGLIIGESLLIQPRVFFHGIKFGFSFQDVLQLIIYLILPFAWFLCLCWYFLLQLWSYYYRVRIDL